MAITDFPFHIIKAPGLVTAIPLGIAMAPTLDGEGISSEDGHASGSYLEHATADAGQPASGGLITTFDVTAAQWEPIVECVIRTGSNISNLRFWADLFSIRPDGIQAPQVGQQEHFAAFRYDPTVAGLSDPGNWYGISSRNDGVSSVRTAVAVAPNTVYVLKVAVQPSGVQFHVNDNLEGTGAEVPAATVLLGLCIRVTRLSGSQPKTIEWSRVSWIHGT